MLQRHLAQPSFEDFVRMGIDDTAYIKPVTIRGEHLYAVHAADGTLLALSQGRDLAFATVRQHEMFPTSVH